MDGAPTALAGSVPDYMHLHWLIEVLAEALSKVAWRAQRNPLQSGNIWRPEEGGGAGLKVSMSASRQRELRHGERWVKGEGRRGLIKCSKSRAELSSVSSRPTSLPSYDVKEVLELASSERTSPVSAILGCV